ncbi:MAG: hypothetical protein VYD19_01310, partial [Myxococcota bacterium]|nr:hypothetical protein [Myxococcota bacterium]
ELNPRFGGALARLNSACPRLPLYLLHLCTVANALSAPRPDALRELILAAADANPIARANYVIKDFSCHEGRKASLRWVNGAWEVIDPSAHREGESTLLLGPSSAGSILFVTLSPRDLDGDRPALKRLLSAYRAAAALWPDLPLDL